jgi:hypothetical protein
MRYRIVAKRLGYEKTRLERAPCADDDPNLYPKKTGSLFGMRPMEKRTGKRTG